MAAEEPVSLPWARCWTAAVTCRICARSAARRPSRIENLLELVSAAREHESRNSEPSLGGFVDQLSLLVRCGRRGRFQERQGGAADHAQRQGARTPSSSSLDWKKGCFPHSRSSDDEVELEEERRCIRRHYARAAPASADVGGLPARVRRLPVHRRVAVRRGDRRAGGRRLTVVPDATVFFSSVPSIAVAAVIAAASERDGGLCLRRRGPVSPREMRQGARGIPSSAWAPSSASSRSTTTRRSSSDFSQWGRNAARPVRQTRDGM